MKKFNPNKNIIITLVIVIIVVTIISVTAAQRANEGKPNFFQSVVNDSVSFVDRAISAPVRWVENGVDLSITCLLLILKMSVLKKRSTVMTK